MIVDICGLYANDLLILLDGLLQDVARLRAGLRVAHGAEINAAKKLARVEIIGIALDNGFGLIDRFTNAPSLRVKLGHLGVEKWRLRIELRSEAVFVYGLRHQIGAAGHSRLIFVIMRERVVIISLRLVGFHDRLGSGV